MFSRFVKNLQAVIIENNLGKLTDFNISTSHGLAFTDHYSDSRKLRLNSCGVAEYVGIHYIYLILKLFGKIIKTSFNFKWNADKNPALNPDTCYFDFEMNNGMLVRLRHSYAGPFYHQMTLMGVNGYWQYDGRSTNLYFPRDTYIDGRFAPPPFKESQSIDFAAESRDTLAKSHDYFFSIIENGKFFSLVDLELALEAMEPIFFYKKCLEKSLKK